MRLWYRTLTREWRVDWLWSEVYKGIEFHLGGYALSLVHTPRVWRERGW